MCAAAARVLRPQRRAVSPPAALGLAAAGLVASPITGPAGNHEYLLWLRGQGPSAGDASGVDAGAIKKLVTRTLATS